jgi:putative DNA primase/helicase
MKNISENPVPDKPGDPIVAAWSDRAPELAEWAIARFVVRSDCFGAYSPVERRGQTYTRRDGTIAKVPKSFTAKNKVTLDLLARHFRGLRPEHVIGLHSTSTSNTSLAARVDIDAHGPGGNDPSCNLKAAIAWYDNMVSFGFRPLLNGSNGAGGYHLTAMFTEMVPTSLVYGFLRWLTDDHAQHGLAVRPEIFPKQAFIPAGGYGNWLRLPGRHHTLPYFSEVWDGSCWLAGAEAIAHLLTLTGDSPELIPAAAKEQEPSKVTVRVRFVPARPRRFGTGLERRISAYLAKLPNLGEGQGRDDVAYKFAAFLTRDLALDDSTVLDWMSRWDAGNSPPKGRECLAEIMANARRYGQRVVGSAAGGCR